MRTTLSIDDDVLVAVKGLALTKRQSIGEVISDLARQALMPTAQKSRTRNGISLLPIRSDGKIVTLDMVNQFRDEIV